MLLLRWGNFRRWEEEIKILFSDMPFASRTRKEVEMYENNAAPEKKNESICFCAAFSVESKPDADTVLSYRVLAFSSINSAQNWILALPAVTKNFT